MSNAVTYRSAEDARQAASSALNYDLASAAAPTEAQDVFYTDEGVEEAARTAIRSSLERVSGQREDLAPGA